jgi:hypothetical protein
MITAYEITRAEQDFRAAGSNGGMRQVHVTADVDSEAVARFVATCRETVQTGGFDVNVLDTVLMHAFIVGVRSEQLRRQNEGAE